MMGCATSGHLPDGAPELRLRHPNPDRRLDHVHLRVTDLERSARFYEAVLAAGGRDNGAPGERSYHPGYYAAYVLDPDGYNVEAVCHGPLKRSAPSVVLTPLATP